MTESNHWQAFFDRHAPQYMDEVFVQGTQAEVDFLVEHLQLSPDQRILDMGCGTGRHALELARRGYQVTGVDLSDGMLAEGRNIFIGLAEEPTWVRFRVDAAGNIEETGRVSFAQLGPGRIMFGNTIVDEDTAVSVFGAQRLAVIWNPREMVIEQTVALDHLAADGFDVENWTTVAHNGLVYIPSRWVNWETSEVRPRVATAILDPENGQIVGVAEDDRCASGGRIVFDDDGYGYVMGDGRNYSIQMFARARGETPPNNCVLRIAPGATDFDPGYIVNVNEFTGGLESIGELNTAIQGSGVAFSMIFHEDRLPSDVEPVDFGFWGEQAFKLWRIELGDNPTAQPVADIPFSALGFSAAAVAGKLYSPQSPDGANTVVYEVDPETGTAVQQFEMEGFMMGLERLEDAP